MYINGMQVTWDMKSGMGGVGGVGGSLVVVRGVACPLAEGAPQPATPGAGSPSDDIPGTALRGRLRHARALHSTEIGEIVALFDATNARGGVQHFGVRPADVNDGNVGDVYVECKAYKRRKHYYNSKCQTWKSSGGRRGSTELRSESGSRTFLRKYGCARPPFTPAMACNQKSHLQRDFSSLSRH